ncbi:MAG: hypothetical protein Q4D52_03505 [Eubacteriales bacterium]|nr:hypothetical protein [Eubacteriales bacterium]
MKKTVKMLVLAVLLFGAGLFFSNTKAEAADYYTGWKQVGKDYYYYSYGELVKGSQYSLRTIDGEDYALDTKTGRMLTGWVSRGNNWYYCNPKAGGAAASGWKKINNRWFYLRPTSKSMVTGHTSIDGHYYYFSSEGVMKTGWQRPWGNTWYYYHRTEGYELNGWQKLGGQWYYLGTSGAMVSNGKHTIDGDVYYFNTQGVMQTGWVKSYSSWYFFNSNGKMQTGWMYRNGNWYYLNEPYGFMYYGGYHYINGIRYWFYDDGRLY